MMKKPISPRKPQPMVPKVPRRGVPIKKLPKPVNPNVPKRKLPPDMPKRPRIRKRFA